jgi:protein-L-isoaspartate(D-aspartate) O-methyltransferase
MVVSMGSRLIAVAAALAASCGAAAPDEYAQRRDALVAGIRNLAATAGTGEARVIAPRVLKAIRQVPRHLFVPPNLRDAAYEDRPLPIGDGQTISQPYIVALMTHLLDPEPSDVMLEVGTGSGYQAAVLSRLVGQVYSIEIVAPLAQTARERLHALGYHNVTVRQGDGYAGWPEHGPFDGIIVTAGAEHVPQPLVRQLKPGGRMVIPVGPRWREQELLLIEKRTDGRVHTRNMGAVSFVPLTGANKP